MKKIVHPMIRAANASDAAPIRLAQVQSWRESYRGIVPDSTLSHLDTTPTEWNRILSGNHGVFVTEDEHGLAGFVAAGFQRDRSLHWSGEIYAIYLLARAQRRGLGRALIHTAATHLRSSGHTGASLWVMSANTPAMQFYHHLGGVTVGESSFELDGVSIAETAFAWDDLDALARA